MDYLMIMGTALDCSQAAVLSVMTLIGWVVTGVKIAVPVILVVVGMIDLAKAVNEKSEDKIKEAQKKLITKAITAVIVFLIPTFVMLLMSILGSTDYKACFDCVKAPTGATCGITLD